MNRIAFIAVLAGGIFAASAFFILMTRQPDDVGDGAGPDRAAVAELPPRPDSAASRDASTPPRPAPEPPRAPRTPRRESRKPATMPPAPAAPTTATLRIVSDVAGAQVFLNREFVGATPATARNLPPGDYQLNVAAPGYDNHVETISVAPGTRELTINFREVRLNASIDVVHKHRFGSCKGTLIATADGLRYDTTDKDDAFSASLLDLERFQVDYLSKNLRIQPRKGKRYDFTDPEGNADRLFVFHRDVDRARERLKNSDSSAGH